MKWTIIMADECVKVIYHKERKVKVVKRPRPLILSLCEAEKCSLIFFYLKAHV